MRVKDKPLRFIDETFRDAQQSIIATRMRTEDMEPIASDIDKVGFYAAEVAGGASFDVAIRYLDENPWERIRILRKLMPNTPLQMHFRGQNLLGYRNYPDDVVSAFVHHASEQGIDVFRIFDALNDERNLAAPLKAIKECGKHAQLQLQYSLTESRLGGPVYTIDYFVGKARIFEEIGADSICIADTCGLPTPYDSYNLITALKKAIKIPVDLHTHYDSGMASMACLKAVEAGVDIIDTAAAPFALRSSFPAAETMAIALQGTPRDTGLDISRLIKIGKYLESVAFKYREFMNTSQMSAVDTEAFVNQVPGGMITNLLAQLKELKAADRIKEVCAEIPRVRAELGYPPLATPISQIVAAQSAQNVLLGRYKVVLRQVKDYALGYYGKPPAPIGPEVMKMLFQQGKKETPITCRPADLLEPEMDKAREATKGIAQDVGDVLIYALYPKVGMDFLRRKCGLEARPEKP
jgi:pyruvate carboxylase subunit B